MIAVYRGLKGSEKCYKIKISSVSANDPILCKVQTISQISCVSKNSNINSIKHGIHDTIKSFATWLECSSTVLL